VGILEAGRLRAAGPPAELIREGSAGEVFRLELAGPANGIVEVIARLPAVQSVHLVYQTETTTVLDLTLNDPLSPDAGLWEALADRKVKVKRYGPKDDGLVSLLKRPATSHARQQVGD